VILLRVKDDAKRERAWRYRVITAARASDAVARSLKQPVALSPTSYSAIAYDVFGYGPLCHAAGAPSSAARHADVRVPCLMGMPASLKSLFQPRKRWLDWPTYSPPSLAGMRIFAVGL
jgi:hypothetical protein